MTTRPEALRLAEAIDPLTRYTLDNLTCSAAAAELRRLHEENERLLAANLDCIEHFNQIKADYDDLKAAHWVGLTDEERKKLCGDGINGKVFQEISKMVEAKLREKNGGKK